MRRVEHAAHVGCVTSAYILIRRHKRRDHLGKLDIDGRIILNQILLK
jgi:hypothetical protein